MDIDRPFNDPAYYMVKTKPHISSTYVCEKCNKNMNFCECYKCLDCNNYIDLCDCYVIMHNFWTNKLENYALNLKVKDLKEFLLKSFKNNWSEQLKKEMNLIIKCYVILYDRSESYFAFEFETGRLGDLTRNKTNGYILATYLKK